MGDLLTAFAPILAFMLIPIWIPLATAVIGAAVDLLRRPRTSATRRAVEAAKARSTAHRHAPTVQLSVESAGGGPAI